jgi:hypothetical protein
MNAGLTDNGVQVCSIVNLYDDGTQVGVPMNCISGYSAYIRYGVITDTITYSYGSFSGEFTCQRTSTGLEFGGTYCNARVWGC